MAELIVSGGHETLDLAPLDFTRIPERRRLVERTIV
jgi:hypothetical protein